MHLNFSRSVAGTGTIPQSSAELLTQAGKCIRALTHTHTDITRKVMLVTMDIVQSETSYLILSVTLFSNIRM